MYTYSFMQNLSFSIWKLEIGVHLEYFTTILVLKETDLREVRCKNRTGLNQDRDESGILCRTNYISHYFIT
jgi:hypothetical protein